VSNIKPAVTDEMLSAYLDGMLDGDDMRAVEHAMEKDPQSTRRLARMIRNDRLLRARFHAVSRRPVPEPISALLEPAAEPDHSWWTSLVGDVFRGGALPGLARLAGITAVVAVLGIGVMTLPDRGTGPNEGRTDTSVADALPSTNPELSRLLDRQPSGELVTFGNGTLARIELSFEHAEGRYCRQYRVAHQGESTSFAVVACRLGTDWQEVLVQRIDAPLADSGQFHAASGPDSSVLDSYIVEHMAGDIMVGDSEVELIRRDWSKP